MSSHTHTLNTERAVRFQRRAVVGKDILHLTNYIQKILLKEVVNLLVLAKIIAWV